MADKMRSMYSVLATSPSSERPKEHDGMNVPDIATTTSCSDSAGLRTRQAGSARAHTQAAQLLGIGIACGARAGGRKGGARAR